MNESSGLSLFELIIMWLAILSIGFLPSLNEIKDLKKMGVNDSTAVTLQVIMEEWEIKHYPLNPSDSSETSGGN